MSPELDAAIVRDFPELYRSRNADWCRMSDGFACGDGWEPIIRRASKYLEMLRKVAPANFRVDGVKSKLGTLRISTSIGGTAIAEIINRAYQESLTTCEQCGADGKLRRVQSGPRAGYILTACSPCFDQVTRRIPSAG